jgi:hypothetical protein
MGRLFCVLLTLALAGCAASGTGSTDHRDFAIDTFYPSPNVLQRAEARARGYWGRNAARLGPESRYLAIDADFIFPSEITQNLWAKLINSETTASFFAHGTEDLSVSDLELHGILVFDTKTGHLVSREGYVLVDTPQRGASARFGDYIATFIGTGA